MKIKSGIYDYGPMGQRIKNARKEKRLTQEYLAERLDVSVQHISEIERGFSGLSVPSLMEICRILEVDSDYILFGVSGESENPIQKILKKMSPEQAMYAEEIITAYAKACKII